MKKGSQARRKLLPQVCIRKKKSAEKGISRSAERDKRPTAFDPCHLLKKVD